MIRRKLTLNREALTELTSTELGDVVAGIPDAPQPPTFPLAYCLTLAGSHCIY